MRNKNTNIIKKILCIFIGILLLCMQGIIVIAKDNTPIVFGNDSTINSSGGFINIKLSSNIGICGGNFNIVFDSSLLQYNEYISNGNAQFQVNSNYASNKVRVTFASSNTLSSGTIIQLHFQSKVDYSFTTEITIETIRLYDNNGNFYEPEDYTFNCSTVQNIYLQSAHFIHDSIQLGIGEEYAMSFVTDPVNASLSRVFWSVSDERIASISNDGLLKGLKKGEVSVYCDIYGSYGNYVQISCQVSVYEKPNLSIGTVHGGIGSEVKVRVMLEKSSKNLTSGSFNIEYDPEILSIKSASIGKALNNYISNININYKPNAIRVNFVGQVPITSGECLTLVFETKKAGVSELKPYNISFFTPNGEEYSPNIGIGKVEVSDITVSSVLVKNKNNYYVAHIDFDSSVNISSGTIMFEYDPTLMEVEKCFATADNYTVVINETYAPGKIRISFASTDARNIMRIARITLKPLKQINNSDCVVVTSDFYDDNNNKVFPTPTTTYFANAKIIDYTIGDINNDDVVDNKDLFAFMRYLSHISVTVNSDALDVNGDGKVNNKDLTRLFRYLSGWNVEIF